jgi:ribosomal protein L32
LGKPKKRTTSRRSGARRSHLVQKLSKRVNAKSPVKVGQAKPRTDQPA